MMGRDEPSWKGTEQIPSSDEIRVIAYDSEDNEIENPRFGDATAFQPPMAVRLGFEVDF